MMILVSVNFCCDVDVDNDCGVFCFCDDTALLLYDICCAQECWVSNTRMINNELQTNKLY